MIDLARCIFTKAQFALIVIAGWMHREHAAFAERISETDLRLDRKSEIRCAVFPKTCRTKYAVEFFDPTTFT